MYAAMHGAGRLLKGEESHARSRYEEDVMVNNHTAIWGSFWQDGQWGYACCHQFNKNSYCLGEVRSASAPCRQVELAAHHASHTC